MEVIEKVERIKAKDWIALWILIGLLVIFTVLAVIVAIMNYGMFFIAIAILSGVITASLIVMVLPVNPIFKKPIFCVLITASILLGSLGLAGILIETESLITEPLIKRIVIIGSFSLGALLALSGVAVILGVSPDEI